ncbi:MAG: phosphoserine phosphatase SerB [Deltaproteobacteria bacterium]|nr:phosphoserine phosphatase SerB [Deltaproteobacteria bacterium]
MAMALDRQPFLITVTGQDRPGITARLTSIIAESPMTILDMEQVVIRNLLSLSIVLEPDGPGPLREDEGLPQQLLTAAREMGMEAHFTRLPPGKTVLPSPGFRYILTLIAETNIPARVISLVTQKLADHGFNIDKIQRLDQGRVRCLEMVISSPNPQEVKTTKKDLLPISREYGLDIALQPDTLFRRVKRLVVFDLDSTLIQGEVIDELARVAHAEDEVRHITEEAMNGRVDFKESLIRRVSLLKGITADQMEAVYHSLHLTPGAEELIRVLRRLGYKTAVISGGFTYFSERIRQRLQLDYAYANTLELENGCLTGRVTGDIIDGERKASLLEEIARRENIHLDQVIAIGDGANDLPMLGKAGLGIAFNAKPMVREAAEHSISQSHLGAILFLLGITEGDITALNQKPETNSRTP